jgi:hypothetical protein
MSARRHSSVYQGFDTPGRCVAVPLTSSDIALKLAILRSQEAPPSSTSSLTGGVSSRAATAAHSPLPTTAACSCRNATLTIPVR